jgi:hypothetical protein
MINVNAKKTFMDKCEIQFTTLLKATRTISKVSPLCCLELGLKAIADHNQQQKKEISFIERRHASWIGDTHS